MSTTLRSARLRRGLRAAELAQEVGVHPMSVLRWERQERLPGPAHIRGLARALDLEPERVAGFFDGARPAAPAAAAGHRGAALRSLRWQRGLTARVVAERVGLPPSTVYNWEAGRVRIPDGHVPALADLLGIAPEVLVTRLAAPAAVVARPAAPPSALRRLRLRSRLSQSGAARSAGVGRQALGGWERGESVPPLAAVRRLAHCYGVPVSAVARAAGVSPPRLLDPRTWGPGDLPEALRVLRAWSGVTQRQLAAACGCSAAAVRTWEAGRAVPAARTLRRLEAALGLPSGALDAATPRGQYVEGPRARER